MASRGPGRVAGKGECSRPPAGIHYNARMTLILTWLTHRGIVMAGDSAITAKPVTGQKHVKQNFARKVFWHERLRAGLSAWGLWDVHGRLLHDWLEDFISRDQSGTICALANTLAKELTQTHGANLTGRARAGIHVVGYESHRGQPVPIFFHVHDGGTEPGWAAPVCTKRDEFEAVKDVTAEVFQARLAAGQMPVFRNGDLVNFAVLQSALEAMRQVCQQHGFIVPHPDDLAKFAEYAVVQVRLLSDLYRLGNTLPSIGGRIDCLTFTSDGQRTMLEWHPAASSPRMP
jgi:hypothetical protein